jgi:hypothetical protein
MLGEETFHPDTRALLAYGRALAGAGAAPKKGGADQVLERLFVIERAKDGRMPIRTFGKDLVALFGRDLRDHDFSRLLLAPDLNLVNALIDACAAAGEPGIMRVLATTGSGKALGAEVLLTPLKVDETWLLAPACRQDAEGHAACCGERLSTTARSFIHHCGHAKRDPEPTGQHTIGRPWVPGSSQYDAPE